MPYRNKQMLRDANGDLIPQYWDVAAGDFKPLTGSGGANDTRLTGSNVEDEDIGFEEGIYDSLLTSRSIQIPKGVKGAVIFIRASGITGTFESGEGVSISARIGVTGNWLILTQTDYKRANTFNGALIFGRGTNLGNSVPAFASVDTKTVSIDLTGFNYIQVRIHINGEMATGEGAHVTTNSIRWIY